MRSVEAMNDAAGSWGSFNPVSAEQRHFDLLLIARTINDETLKAVRDYRPSRTRLPPTSPGSKGFCITATRVGMDVFAALRAEPILPSQFSTVRPVRLELIVGDVRLGDDGEPYIHRKIEVGSLSNPHNVGHLGLLADGAIVDPSAGQGAVLPRKAIMRHPNQDDAGRERERAARDVQLVDSVVVPPELRPIDNVTHYAQVAIDGGNTALAYRIDPTYRGHLTSALWHNLELIDEVKTNVLSTLRHSPGLSSEEQAWGRHYRLTDLEPERLKRRPWLGRPAPAAPARPGDPAFKAA